MQSGPFDFVEQALQDVNRVADIPEGFEAARLPSDRIDLGSGWLRLQYALGSLELLESLLGSSSTLEPQTPALCDPCHQTRQFVPFRLSLDLLECLVGIQESSVRNRYPRLL